MTYRTKTYIAGDWTGDKDAVDKLHEWNNSKDWSLSFTDAHDLTQSRDSSLNCSIKSSLKVRMEASKTFVLIVGANTKSVRAGSCQYCSKDIGECGNYTNKSYINYECSKAIRDNLKIVVLYNYASIDKSKCPDSLKNIGTHTAMCYYENGKCYWDYTAVRNAIMG